MLTNGQAVIFPQTNKVRRERTSATTENGYATADIPRRHGSQYFDTILWRLRSRMESVDRSGYLVGVTGCGRQAGVSTVAANLATRAADHRVSPVLLVDASFQNPRQERPFPASNGPGLAEVLTARTAVADAIQSTGVNGLRILPCGRREVLDHAGICQQNLATLLKELRTEFQLVVFDLPDAHDLQQSLLFAAQVDAALLVVRAESVRRLSAQLVMNRLANDGVNVVGAVVTGIKSRVPDWLQRRL